MKPDKFTVYQLFEREERYVVPLFQRPYVWKKDEQWQPLWDDIIYKANQIIGREERDQEIGSHFLGTTVRHELRTSGKQVRKYEIIDGQQRLTTLQVLLTALRNFLKQINFEDEALLGELSRLTRNSGSRSEEVEKYKVWPTAADRATYEAIFASTSPEDLNERMRNGGGGSPILAEAYSFFYVCVDEYVRFGETDDEIDSPEYDYDSEMALTRIDALMEALKRHLEIVVIDLESGDDPQIIFETLNARGAPLLPSDLIRNFVFLEATNNGEDIERLYNQYWLQYDDYDRGIAAFWKYEEEQGRVKRPRIDLFMFHYLTLKVGQEVKITHLFQEFRRWWVHTRKKGERVEQYLGDIAKYSKVYHRLITMDGQSRLGVFIRRLNIMETSTLYPILLYFYGERTDIPASEMNGILIDLESYLVRRMICRLSAKNYNRNFMMVLRDLRRAETVDRAVVRDILAGFEGDASFWPTDDEFRASWLNNPMYGRLAQDRVVLILEALDLQLLTGKQEQIYINDKLTIEHIFPQNPEDGVWPELEKNNIIHTMGNLTLLTSKLNASISNGSFVAKRAEIAKQSRLRMNSYFQELADKNQWDVSDIQERSEQLLDLALAIWPRPAQQTTIRLTAGQQRSIDSLSALAEQNGIGPAFRLLLEAGMRHAFYPRIKPSSILYAPQNNKTRALYTVWVTPKNDCMKVYVVTDAFAEFFKVSKETANHYLGASGWREMTHENAETFALALEEMLGSIS